MSGPIEGIKIIDLTGVVMGPYATRILADLGADVIKVEGPVVDSMRTVRPARHENMAGAILNLHANKRSIVLDLKNKKAVEILLKLVSEADVFVHNMRPTAIARLGLNYASISKVNPKIIFCNACGFGRGGPYSDKAAYDDVIQAASGIPSLFQRARGAPDYVPAAICDKIAGLTIAYSILAALVGRSLGKGGQEIEVGMFESAVAFNLMEHLTGFAFDPPLGEFGWSRVLERKRRPFRTKDGFACILPYSQENWQDFFRFIGRDDLVNDPRVASHPKRIENTDFLYSLIAEAAPRHSTAEWMKFCDERSIPAMPVNDMASLWDDPHLSAVKLLRYADHPTEGRYRHVGLPSRFMSTPTELRRHAPRPGENTVEVLQQIGMAEDDIHELLASGAARGV